MYTKNQLIKMAADLTKKIDGGKLKGKALHRAKKRRYWALWRAGKKGVAHVQKSGLSSKKQKNFDKNQGILPGFLSQLNHVRIEELVAEKLFQSIASKLDLNLDIKKVVNE